jgi:ABC-2 type transport system permease protein
MSKLWAIAWKEIYTTFTDRNLVLIMIASPLVLSAIVALAFGGLGDGDVPIAEIPIAVVNHDQGGELGVNFGEIFVSVLVPSAEDGSGSALPTCETADQGAPSVSLDELTDAVEFDDQLADTLIANGELEFLHSVPDRQAYTEGVAKAAVDHGIYTAAIIIPADFSERVSYVPILHPEIEVTGITVYANRGSPIASGVVRSIAEGITNQIATGNIAIAATFAEIQFTLGPTALAQASNPDLSSAFACAFTPTGNLVRLDTESVAGSSDGSVTRSILVWVGSAQAMFFALFTAQFGVLGLHNERRQGTLQRMVVSPTPRAYILTGSLLGVFITVIFQITILVVALTAVGSLLQGKLDLIWGSEYLLIVGLVLAVGLAVSGFGMLMAAIVKTPEQGQILGPIVNMAMGVLGGAFGFLLPKTVAIFSIVYWGREAFQRLAAGEADIGTNLLVLVVQGAVMYAVGVVLFNRRFKVA